MSDDDDGEKTSLEDIENKYKGLDKRYYEIQDVFMKLKNHPNIKGHIHNLIDLIFSYNNAVQAYNEAYPNKKVQYAILRQGPQQKPELLYYIDYGEQYHLHEKLDKKPYYEYKVKSGGKRLKSKKRTKSRKSKKLKKTRKR